MVIPLDRLGDYSRGIERINIEQSIGNKIRIADAVLDYLQSDLSQILRNEDTARSDEGEGHHGGQAVRRSPVPERGPPALANHSRLADAPAASRLSLLTAGEQLHVHADDSLLDLLLRRDLVISYRREVAAKLNEVFAGGDMAPLRSKLEAIHANLRDERLFVALHMHAGDGNVHTNIRCIHPTMPCCRRQIALLSTSCIWPASWAAWSPANMASA